ncbi:MAG: hypothetical protein V4577_16835 [Bacteroidota bacterium]
MKRLSDNPGWVMMAFVVVFLSGIIYANISAGIENALPFTLAGTAFSTAILFVIYESKTVNYDKEKLYYKTFLSGSLNEIPLERIHNIAKVPGFSMVYLKYQVVFYDENNILKSIFFHTISEQSADEVWEKLNLKRNQ